MRSCIQFCFRNFGLHPKNIFCYPGLDGQVHVREVNHAWPALQCVSYSVQHLVCTEPHAICSVLCAACRLCCATRHLQCLAHLLFKALLSAVDDCGLPALSLVQAPASRAVSQC